MDALEVIPGQQERSTPVFKTPEEARRFREAYVAAVTPELERLAWARANSWAESQRRWVR